MEVLSNSFLRSIKDDGPVWAKDSVVVQDKGNKTGCVLGICYNSDLVCDLTVYNLILRGRRSCCSNRRFRCNNGCIVA